MATKMCRIGPGIHIRGHLSGSENLTVEGRVEGEVVLDAQMFVDEGGTVAANVQTKELVVRGKMSGNTHATERISLTSTATLVGDLRAPRIILEDGANFTGKIEMDVPLPDDL